MEATSHPARERMKALGILTDKGLAALAQTYPPVISNWLARKSGLSKEVGRRVAVLLGVPVETVLFDWGPAPKPPRRRRVKR